MIHLFDGDITESNGFQKTFLIRFIHFSNK